MTALPLTLTYAEAKVDLEAVAAEAPERTIRDMGGACVYFVPTDDVSRRLDWGDLAPGEGCCIVGRVLEKRGVHYQDMQTTTRKMNEGYVVADLAKHGALVADEATVRLLDAAQEKQDIGWSWAEAVRYAIEVIESEPPC